MKRISCTHRFLVAAALSLFLVVALVPSPTYALGLPPPVSVLPPSAPTPTPTPAASPASSAAAPAAPTAAAGASAGAVHGDPNDQCSFGTGNYSGCIQTIFYTIVTKIALVFLTIAAVFAGVAGLLFNWTVYITVFQFGNLIGNNPGMLAAWGVLRDMGNICLLFGFIFMGVSTILNLPGNEFTAKRALPALIIFAVLMNFSLFAAEAVIDTSNALGTTLYKQASLGQCAEGENFFDCAKNKGIGGSIMQISGIAAILDPNAGAQITNEDLGAVIEIVGLTIFAAVTAFVFMAAVALFITRAVVLAFLMATSPVGFAGMAIPPLHGLAASWWKNIINQAFFAPIYILLILISIRFMEGIAVALGSSTSGSVNLASAFDKSGASNVSMVINFILITGFMLGALQIARSMGAYGGSFATKFAGGATFGVAAWTTRRTVGRGSNRVANMIRSSKFGRTGLGRTAFNIANAGATASFDARSATPVKALLSATHVDAGKVGTTAQHGFHGIEEKAVKARTDYAGKLRQTGEEAELTKTLNDQNKTLERQKETNKENWEGRSDDLLAQIANAERENTDAGRALAAQLKATRAQEERGHKAGQRDIDRQITNNKNTITLNNVDNAKRQYANTIEHAGWPAFAGGNVDRLANHHAAAEIFKSLDKSENQRVIDAIGSLGGRIGGGGGGGHAPAPAAPAGGGGGGAAHH